MTGTSSPPVVVGVDGSPGSLTAVRYAVDEAGRLGTGVRLVHVAPDYTPTTPMLPLIRDDFEQVGRRILRECAALVTEAAPSCETAAVLRSGSTVTTLLEAAEDARLVVLGREHHSLAEAVFTGSTTIGAAGRAACPVVSVPPTWLGRATAWPRRRRREVARALHRAAGTGLRGGRARGGRLVVLHAWKLPGSYDEIVEARTHANDRVREMESQIDPLLDIFRRSHPDVEVELAVVHEQPVRRAPACRRRRGPAGHRPPRPRPAADLPPGRHGPGPAARRRVPHRGGAAAGGARRDGGAGARGGRGRAEVGSPA